MFAVFENLCTDVVLCELDRQALAVSMFAELNAVIVEVKPVPGVALGRFDSMTLLIHASVVVKLLRSDALVDVVEEVHT